MKRGLAGLSVWLVSALAAGYLIYQEDQKPPSQAAPVPASEAGTRPVSAVIIPVPRVPRRPTLDPSVFSEPSTRMAYQIARDKPALLEKMACYCGCMKSIE